MEGTQVSMSDNEFEIMDELYFVVSFDQLMGSIELTKNKVIKVLESLYDKGWIQDPKGKTKSVVVTEEGERKAEEFLEKYFGNEIDG